MLIICVALHLSGIGQTVTGHQEIPPDWFLQLQRSPGYEGQKKFDTIPVRVLIDYGGVLPGCENGWVVRQWFTYYAGIDPGNCIDCPPPPASRWFDTEVLLWEDKKTKIDKKVVWQYRPMSK